MTGGSMAAGLPSAGSGGASGNVGGASASGGASGTNAGTAGGGAAGEDQPGKALHIGVCACHRQGGTQGNTRQRVPGKVGVGQIAEVVLRVDDQKLDIFSQGRSP